MTSAVSVKKVCKPERWRVTYSWGNEFDPLKVDVEVEVRDGFIRSVKMRKPGREKGIHLSENYLRALNLVLEKGGYRLRENDDLEEP